MTGIRRALSGGLPGLSVREPGPPPYQGSPEPGGLPGLEGDAGGRPEEEPPAAAPEPEHVPAERDPGSRPFSAFRPRPAARPPRPGAGRERERPRADPLIGWIAGRYAVADLEGRVYVIDRPARARAARPHGLRAGERHESHPLFPLLVPARVRVAEARLDRFDPETVARYGMVLRRLGPDIASLFEAPRELRYCDAGALARSVIEARTEDVPEVLARGAADAAPAHPEERAALFRELLARPGEILGPAVAREIGETDAERIFTR